LIRKLTAKSTIASTMDYLQVLKQYYVKKKDNLSKKHIQ